MKIIENLFTTLVVMIIQQRNTWCHGINSRISKSNTSDLIDDIKLSNDQLQNMRSRSFLTFNKWPEVDGVPIISYYIESTAVDQTENIRHAVAEYHARTCIRWNEVGEDAETHKVKIHGGDACYSELGYVIDAGHVNNSNQELSLGKSCMNKGVVLHEMGHTVGLVHTHMRPDRDRYVKIINENIQTGKENNFVIFQYTSAFDVPYDYASIMHYGETYFSKNDGFTIMAKDPFGQSLLGNRNGSLRFSDATLINKAYGCIEKWTQKCPELNCQNGGYVDQSCKCYCPENTVGASCEKKLARYIPLPDAEVVSKEKEVVTPGYPKRSVRGFKLWLLWSPRCHLPALEILERKFYPESLCMANFLHVRHSDLYKGDMFCNDTSLPVGKVLMGTNRYMLVYHMTLLNRFPKMGLKMRIFFPSDPRCENTPEQRSMEETNGDASYLQRLFQLE